jgi:hypothetical protein
LKLCVRADNLSAAAWRGAFQALLPQLTAFSLEGADTSLGGPSIFTNFWDGPAEGAGGGERGFRRPRSGDHDQTASNDVAPAASAPMAVVAAFPLERLQVIIATVCHGPLLSLVAEHASNLNDVVLAGTATPGMIDALAAMPRCRSLSLSLGGLTDEHIARILRGGMRDNLRSCQAVDNAFGMVSTFGSRKTVLSDVAASTELCAPKCGRRVFFRATTARAACSRTRSGRKKSPSCDSAGPVNRR